MGIERITGKNLDSWIGDIADLGNGFLQSIGQDPKKDSEEDFAVIRAMIAAGQTKIFLAVTASGKAVSISYFNVGTGFSCRGSYLWINGVFVLPEHRQQGYRSALLAEIEKFGESIGSQLIMSTRDIDNCDSQRLFSRSGFLQEEQVVITKPTPE